MKTNKKRLTILISMMFVLSICVVLSLVMVLNLKDKKSTNKFDKTTDSYITDDSEIISAGEGRSAANSYLRLNTLYTISGSTVSRNSTSYDGSTTISISTPEELYAFSYLCLTNTSFLSYSYALLNNIDYYDYGIGHSFYPVACTGSEFTGTFNGNGYDIKGLRLASLTDISVSSGGDYAAYTNITYFAMFGVVGTSGTVKNLGLIDTDININAPSLAKLQYVAPLVGLNKGRVEYTYAQDLRDAASEKGGITASGNYQISGLVVVNEGTMTNSYTAYSIVVNYTLSMTVAVWSEILLVDEGTSSKLYYFNNSIPDGGYTHTSSKEKIVYDATLIGRTLQRDYLGATYEATLDDLNTAVMASSEAWYSNTSYGTELVKPLKSVVTPILRGLEYNSETKTFTIENEYDYVYMYELFNISSYFASSNITYYFKNDIDMQYIPTENYVYNSNIGCKLKGESKSRTSVKKASGDYSEYPTIFNATIFNTLITEGMNCYGVFPWFTGEIDGLNFYFDNTLQIAPSALSSNANAVGLVSGFAENATIANVNTFGNVTLGANIGRCYVGNIAGVLVGGSTISKSTASGNITGTSSNTYSSSAISGFVNGSAIGGAVGYINDSYSNMNEVLTSVSITAPTYSSSNSLDMALGGVIGAGYTNVVTKLQNKGNITVSGNYYGNLYVAGVIGRLVGVKTQITYFHNQGDLSVTSSSCALYIAGVINVDIQTSAGVLSASLYKNSASKYIFYASSFSNGGLVKVLSRTTSVMYAGVANINSQNNFLSTISGFYNLTYKYGTDNSSKIYDKTALSINMYYVPTFAAVVNTNASSNNGLIDASTIYNFRKYTFVTTQNTNIQYSYSGCINGGYVTGDEFRNEGDLTFTISNNLTSGSKLVVTGIITEVSSGCKISSIYNSGNITINHTATITGDIFAAGICYANKNGFSQSEIEKYNPSSESYNDKAVGSINYCINNGAIEVTNPNYSSISYGTYHDIKSANGSVTTERHFYPSSSPSANVVGDICVSGITNFNYSVITNTFNVADMFAANYINARSRNEINASGLVTYNIGRYAIIENSANDGTVKAINLSFYMVFDNGQSNVNNTTAEYAFVNASGIVCHNDENENGTTYSNSNSHSKQIIAFTINYGSVYSYNVARNSTSSSSSNFRTVSAGILGQGLLNLVNVVNYGNIYGSEVSGGVVGVMFFDSFNTEVNSSNKVTLANTINYANIMVIDKGELNYRDSSYYNQTYSSFKALSSSSTCYYTSIDLYSKDYFNGSIFGIINFSGSTNANNVIIRYLISFNEDVTLVGAEAQTPSSVTVDLSTFYSAYVKYDGSYTLDTYIGKPVVYAPLSTGTEKVNGTTYYGVFNNNFSFRQAVAGNETYLDIAHYPTDSFVTDYFEFVGATYVNTSLLNTIGWGSIAYNAAADSFATDLNGVAKFIDYLSDHNSTQYNNLITAALNTDTWISKCDEDSLLEIVKTLVNNEDNSTLLAMLEYIFSSSATSYSLITSEARTAMLEALVENDSTLDYAALLDSIITYSNGYSSVLADSVINDDAAGTYIYNYINSLSNPTIVSILTTYCDYLKDSSTNAYFDYSNSEKIRYDILLAFFENINDNEFYEYLAQVLNINLSNISLSDEIAMYNGLSKLTDNQLINLYKAIILNNSYANIKTYISSMSTEISYYINMINRGYFKTSLDNIYTDVSATTSASTTTVVDERIDLWNQIRTTDTFKQYLSTKITGEYIAKATEVNNTYQTTTYPYTSANSTNGDLSFTYTFDITPATYFLGPYKNTSKNQFSYVKMTTDTSPTNGDGNTTKRSVMDVTTLAEANYLYDNGYTYSYQFFYYEYSDSSSNNQLCAVQRPGENKYAFTWFKTNYTTDFTGGFLNGTYDDNGIWNGDPVYVTDSAGVTFDVNGGGISKFTSNTSGSTGENGWNNNLNRTGRWTITDVNQKQHTMTGYLTDWADFIIAHEIRHYISYATTDLHSTQCTGLGKYRSGNRWFTWNGSDNIVYTSQYIDYNVNQILALDGYLTSYSDGTTVSSDERDIINSIFNTYFVTDSTNFKNVVAAALLEKNAEIDNDSYYYVGKATFNPTNRIYYTLTATAATSYNANTKYYTKSGSDYLEVPAGTVNSTNYGSYYTVTATRVYDYYKYDNCYEMKDVDGYDTDYIKEFFITNIYSDTLISSSLPLDYLKVPQYIDSGSLITVKNYLKSLTSSVLKEKFIGYCAHNQNAYAKLILELMQIDAMPDPETSITFPVAIGNSSDSGQITISGIPGFTQLSVVNEAATIGGKNFEYGYSFEVIRATLDTKYTKLYLYVYGKSSATFYYSFSNTSFNNYSTQNVWNTYGTVNGATVIEITLNNNDHIDFGYQAADAGKGILYYAYATYDEVATTVNTSNTWTLFNDDDNYEIPGYIMYRIPTAGQIESRINNLITAAGVTDARNITYSVSTKVAMYRNSSSGNNWNRYHRLVIDNDGSTSTANDITVYERATNYIQNNYYYEYSALDSSYLGKYVGLMTATSYNGTYTYNVSNKRSDGSYRWKFYYINVEITYSYVTGTNAHHEIDIIDSGTIINSALAKSNASAEDRLNISLKNQSNYATLYGKLLHDAAYNLVPIDYSSTIADPAHTGTASKNIIEILGLSETHTGGTPEYCVPDLLQTLITSSNEAFAAFISGSVSASAAANSDYSVLLNYLVKNIGYYSLNDAIKNQKNNLSAASKEKIAAAYLATDYKTIIKNETSKYDSYLRTYIDASIPSYEYIKSNGTYDNDKFEDFCNLIGYNLSTSGYGIYALSSNHGKLNGEFIPDNLVLAKMDVPYAYSSTGECYELVSAESASWRGVNTHDGDVQYAFDIEMKQLVKSISTAIFELDLVAQDGTTLYSSESSIDLENKTITYYVPKNSTLINSLKINTNSMVLANNATLYLNGVLVTKGSTTASFALNVGENEGLIRVYAENTAVFDDYVIIIVEADFSFDLTEQGNTASGSYEVPYKDGTLVLNVTSPKSGVTDKDKLPQGMDLKPYITIQDLSGEVMNNAFELEFDPVVDENGSTTINMSILVTLPTGTYDVVVDIYGSVEKYRFIKNPSTEKDIISFVYEGSEIVGNFVLSGSEYRVNSTVLYGRAFSKDELVSYESDDFYLTSIEYSNGASIEVDAEYTETDGLITYVVTYTVTAEDGSTKVYKHYISESAPYTNGSSYVSSYIDGTLDSTQSKNYSSTAANNIINFSFRRGTKPVFRVKYNLGGFYILGDPEYDYVLEKEYKEGDTTVTVLTAGLSIEVNNSADAGTYTFYYKYKSTGDWDGTDYIREYVFPAINVVKLASTNAQLDSITFITSATKISTLSTVIYPLGPIRPTGDDLVVADNEVSYEYLSASESNNLINVDSERIAYNGYDTQAYMNYYIVGAVSNVNLSSYAPTFSIEEYAQIYQYTTLAKLKEYGADNNQVKTDKTILEDTTRVFIYVPYVDPSNNVKIFLIEIDMNNGYKWIAAYEDSWKGTGATTVTSLNATTHAIVLGGVTYTVSDLAGKTDAKNSSLYMNYIGNPLTDSDSTDEKDDSHFWYVSYIVFSEDALVNGTNKIKFYHVSMIDLENTNFFVFTIKAPTTLDVNNIYMTLAYRVYDENGNYSSTKTLSLFADYDETSGTMKVYSSVFDLALLPRAYYYFTLSLPSGYAATYEVTNGKKNSNKNASEEGGYLPPASLIIQEIDITITIEATSESHAGIWAIGTSSTYDVKATEDTGE